MINYCNEIIQSLENKINELSIEIDDQIELAEIVIKHTLENLSEAKNYIFGKGFIGKNGQFDRFFQYGKSRTNHRIQVFARTDTKVIRTRSLQRISSRRYIDKRKFIYTLNTDCYQRKYQSYPYRRRWKRDFAILY